MPPFFNNFRIAESLFQVKFRLFFNRLLLPLVRQAQLGASYRVKVFIGQSLTSSPYRVLRDWEG